jgi:peptidoglycan/LPS O-acetylase OafA/YrhL
MAFPAITTGTAWNKRNNLTLADTFRSAYIAAFNCDHVMEQAANNSITSSDLLQTRPHYEILDGLRGVAAIVVVIFHFMEIVYTDPATNFAGHGFLAVDFFFCLSGFVIAYAYDSRMEKVGFLPFLKLRLIRLHPLVVLGSVLGLLAFLFDPFTPVPAGYGFWQITLLFTMSVLLAPWPSVAERYFNLFNLNAPAWSLFWEYVANLFYGWFLWKTDRRVLLIIAVIAAAGLGYIALTAGNLVGGWSGGTFWHGGARVAYSFTAGMIVYRFKWIIPNRLGFAGVTLLLLAGLTMPYFPNNNIVEWTIVVLYFPLLVALGAGARLHEKLRNICVFSGKISYPLYMTHYSVMWIFGGYYAAYKPGTPQLALIISIGLIVLLTVAWITMKFYDEPVRAFLRKKVK